MFLYSNVSSLHHNNSQLYRNNISNRLAVHVIATWMYYHLNSVSVLLEVKMKEVDGFRTDTVISSEVIISVRIKSNEGTS